MVVVWKLALAGVLLAPMVTAMFYLWRLRLLRRLPACDTVDRLGLFHAALAFASECAALVAAIVSLPLGWTLAGCSRGHGARGPIILVHDWGVNAGSLWCLRRRLLRDGWGPVCCLGGWRKGACGLDVEGAAQGLRQVIHQVASGNQPLTLIGHGVGGLVLRYCARRYSTPAVRRIVTLGTPHRGTELPRLGRVPAMLAPGAPLLSKLNAVDHLPQQFDVIAIHSTFDAMVLPPANATYPGAFNIQVNDIGHAALLFSPKVYRLIAENLARRCREVYPKVRAQTKIIHRFTYRGLTPATQSLSHSRHARSLLAGIHSLWAPRPHGFPPKDCGNDSPEICARREEAAG